MRAIHQFLDGKLPDEPQWKVMAARVGEALSSAFGVTVTYEDVGVLVIDGPEAGVRDASRAISNIVRMQGGDVLESEGEPGAS